ncbi:hypothetical protein LguiB_003930 [Lonicera macranthoides]
MSSELQFSALADGQVSKVERNAKIDQVKVSMENGILTVVMPKQKEKKPEVKAINNFVLSTVLSPEQKDHLGFFTVLPAVTKERQSARLRITLEQSTAGAGAAWWASEAELVKEQMARRRVRVSDSWDRHFVGSEMNEEIDRVLEERALKAECAVFSSMTSRCVNAHFLEMQKEQKSLQAQLNFLQKEQSPTPTFPGLTQSPPTTGMSNTDLWKDVPKRRLPHWPDPKPKSRSPKPKSHYAYIPKQKPPLQNLPSVTARSPDFDDMYIETYLQTSQPSVQPL